VAEAPAENPESAGLVAEPQGDGGGRRAFGEVGAERFVLTLARVGRFQEEPAGFCYRI
jgi:hypothetical protein